MDRPSPVPTSPTHSGRAAAEGPAPSRVLAVVLTVAVALLAALLAPAWARAQGAPASTAGAVPGSIAMERWNAVLGVLAPTPDAYLEPGALKPTVTLETSAFIPGLPVRQHPLNAGLFDTGCAQCHRLVAPLPANSGAPADVFGAFPRSPVTGPAPDGFTRLTADPGRDEVPLPSPDGTRLAFERLAPDGSSWDLMLAAPDGSGARAVLRNAGWAEWSPAGDRLVAWSGADGGRGQLVLLDVTSGEARPLTDGAGAAFPTWSPDGSRIVYQSRSEAGAWSLAILDPATGSSRTITPPDQSMPSRPQFAPDGLRIAYQVAAHGQFGLWRLEFPAKADGSPDYEAQPQSIPGSTLLPMDIGQARGNSTWSPDGTRVALQMVDLTIAPTGAMLLSYKTWITDPDGTHPLLLVGNGTLADRSPSFSPTGHWLVQWSWNDDLRASVWLVRPDGSHAVDLTEALGGDALYPSWSPDGRSVVFSSDREGTFDLWRADLATLVPGFEP